MTIRGVFSARANVTGSNAPTGAASAPKAAPSAGAPRCAALGLLVVATSFMQVACSAEAGDFGAEDSLDPNLAASVDTTPGIGLDTIMLPNELEPVENANGTEFAEWARAVAFVNLGGGSCTGFRLSKDLFMTNHHCYDGSPCSQTTFTLEYKRSVPQANRRVFACSRVETFSRGLDFAIYRVRPTTQNADDNPEIVRLSPEDPVAGMPLFMAGHPQGRLMEIDRSSQCAVTTAPTASNNYFNHRCDTEGGNSGSSVFARATGAVVGIHWGGSASGGGPTASNTATSMKRVLDFVRTQAPALYNELTIDGSTTPPPTPPPPPPPPAELRIASISPANGATVQGNRVLTVSVTFESASTVTDATLDWRFSNRTVRCSTAASPWSCTRSGNTFNWSANVGTDARTFAVSATNAAGQSVTSPAQTIRLMP